jgi:hypothetical protein
MGITLETQGKFEDAMNVYQMAEQNINLAEEENLYLRMCEVRTSQYLDATMRGRESQRRETSLTAKQYVFLPLRSSASVLTF